MGNFFGRQFVRNDKIVGQGKQLLLFAKKIRLQKVEVDRIFEEFCQLADPTTYLLETSKIATSKKRPYNLITTIILQIYDRNKQGTLNFLEYLMVMYSFLSADEEQLARMSFQLFDIYKVRALDVGEIKYLINVIWEFKPNKRCINAINKLDQNLGGVVTLEEFILLSRHHYDLLRPLREQQRKIQQKTVFRRFWRQITYRRVEYFGTQSMFELCECTDPSYIESSMEYLNLRVDVIPLHYIEQWNFIQRRKAARGTLHQDLPYEIKEMIKPHPLNASTKKSLRSVAKSMGVWSKFRKKVRVNKASTLPDEGEEDGEESLGGKETEQGEEEERVGELPLGLPSGKLRPFDDSYLGSQKGSRAP